MPVGVDASSYVPLGTEQTSAINRPAALALMYCVDFSFPSCSFLISHLYTRASCSLQALTLTFSFLVPLVPRSRTTLTLRHHVAADRPRFISVTSILCYLYSRSPAPPRSRLLKVAPMYLLQVLSFACASFSISFGTRVRVEPYQRRHPNLAISTFGTCKCWNGRRPTGTRTL